ncbi:MAG: AbrB/MazE/SpoVT family DNA-binding domain-containing protein [Actinobacteria bacterium]|nr:AbrB/MazE/SpoVT family DNA-binding domain-containing protein [Actinomycetota bacterium]
MKLINSVRIGKKGQIVIPEYIRKNLKLGEKSILSIYLDNNKILLIPADKMGTITRGMLKGTWGRTRKEVDEYIRKERESWNRNY